jgi:hypothetical protein
MQLSAVADEPCSAGRKGGRFREHRRVSKKAIGEAEEVRAG